MFAATDIVVQVEKIQKKTLNKGGSYYRMQNTGWMDSLTQYTGSLGHAVKNHSCHRLANITGCIQKVRLQNQIK